MKRFRRRQALLLAGLLLFLTFFLFVLVDVWSVPTEMHLSPGEIGRLRVNFPLILDAPEGARTLLAGSLPHGTELVFRSISAGACTVELKLLGAIAVRKVSVNILPERKVVPSGQAIGVLLAAEGVVVVGHQPLRGLDGKQYYPAEEAGIELGDIITKVNGTPVYHAEELTQLINDAGRHARVKLTIRRAGRHETVTVQPVLCRGPEEEGLPRAMLGLFVEDPAAGVGTMTFFDPSSGSFAALGHRIVELGGQRHVTLEGGKIVAARISGIQQGQRGNPGEKIGTFSGPEDIIGTIESNTRFGLFGKLDGAVEGREAIPVALAHQVHAGPATILTVVQGTEIREFKVEILRAYRQASPHDKGMVLKVIDPVLLSLTGGIVQGMSGSPVIQDGRLAGAVTHVFVNDPTRGYGVLAEWMLQEMDSAAASNATSNAA